MAPPILFTVACVVSLLVAEQRGSRPGVWLFKPLAASGFIVTALAAGALESGYGRCLLVALVLCWVGDVLLIPRDAPRIFRAGLLSFLLAHLGFCAAFLLSGRSLPATGIAAIAVLPAGVGVLRWLSPHVPVDMKGAVRAYLVVISAMLVCATSALGTPRGAWVLVGALLFYLSDLAVARDRFVAPGFRNRAWGLPLYFAAQLILAASSAPPVDMGG